MREIDLKLLEERRVAMVSEINTVGAEPKSDARAEKLQILAAKLSALDSTLKRRDLKKKQE
jgi:hypothetical protein